MATLKGLKRIALSAAGTSLLALFLLTGLCLPAWGAGTCPDSLVMDGCFEEEVDPYSPSWIQYSENFGSPLCDTELCGSYFVPRTGAWGVWFGGTGALVHEEAYIQQSITMPSAGIVPLQFHIWSLNVGTLPDDFMRVTLDGTQLFFTLASNSDYRTGYTQVTLNLSAYADGGIHTLRFESVIRSETDIFVDDVSRPDKKFVNISKIVNFADDQLQFLIDKTLLSQELRGQVFDSKEDILVNLDNSSATLNIRGGFGFDFSSNAGTDMTTVRSLEVWSGAVSLQKLSINPPSSIKGLTIKPGGTVIAQGLVVKPSL